ncbi:MAG: hypothetical protein RIT81_42845 [Deltaproteobacteria bacterium]
MNQAAESVGEWVDELVDAKRLLVDDEALLMWRPGAASEEPPDSSKSARGWINRWTDLPSSPLLEAAAPELDRAMRARGFDAEAESFASIAMPHRSGIDGASMGLPPNGEGSGEPHRSQEQEQEQEQEHCRLTAGSVATLYEEILVPVGWPPPPRSWPEPDDERGIASMSDAFGADAAWWRATLQRAQRSWLTTQARSGKRWASLRGVCLDTEKLRSLLDGAYDDTKAKGTSDKDAIGAWTMMVAEAKKSPDRRQRPADPRARSALTSVGGFATIGRSSQRDLPKLRTRFVEAFLGADVAVDHDGITPLFGGDRRAG